MQNEQQLDITTLLPSRKRMAQVAILLVCITYFCGYLVARYTFDPKNNISMLKASLVWGTELCTISAFIFVGWIFSRIFIKYTSAINNPESSGEERK